MSDPAALRFLASQYASGAAHRPLEEHRQRDGRFMIDALEELALLGADGARTWRDRLGRLGVDPLDQPLLPRALRDAATAYLDDGPEERRAFASHALQAVGALSWVDATGDAHTPPKLEVDRVIAVAPTAASWLTVSSVVLYLDAIEISWYASSSAPLVPDVTAATGVRSPFGLTLSDDRDTVYIVAGSSSSGDPERVSPGRTTFQPAPPSQAAWVEVVQGGVPLLRVPL